MVTEARQKCGRPPVMSASWYAALQQIWGDRVTTRRGILNHHYETMASKVVARMVEEGVTGLEYIVDKQKQTVNMGVLRALGQFNDHEIRVWAVEICKAQQKPESKKTIHEWEWLLRQYRLGRISETVSDIKE